MSNTFQTPAPNLGNSLLPRSLSFTSAFFGLLILANISHAEGDSWFIDGIQAIQKSMAVDNNNNVYSVGYFQYTTDLNPSSGTDIRTSSGMEDMFITKYDDEGVYLWSKTIGSTGNDQALAIAIDISNSIYVLGHFKSTVDFDPGAGVYQRTSLGSDNNIVILKLGSDGAFQWAHSLGAVGSQQSPHAIDVHTDGSVYLTGFYYGTIDFNPGAGVDSHTASYSNIFVSKYDSLGNYFWTKDAVARTSTSGFVTYSDLSTDENGVYLAGTVSGTLDFDPGPGVDSRSTSGIADFFIQALDHNGNRRWTRNIGGAGTDYAQSLSLSQSGDLYIAGFFSSSVDFGLGNPNQFFSSKGQGDVFLLNLDSEGLFKWVKTYGGIYHDEALSTSVSPSGDILVTGRFRYTVDFDPSPNVFSVTGPGNDDLFLTAFTPEGESLYTRVLGGLDNDSGRTVRVTSNGEVFFAGDYTGPVDFDLGSATNLRGSSGYFIYKLFMHQISGQVTVAGSPLADATVTVNLAGGQKRVSTDSLGQYAITGIPDMTNYELAVTKSGFAFDKILNELESNAVHNIDGVVAFSISGRIFWDGQAMRGTVIESEQAGAIETDASGYFELNDFPAGAHYSLTPQIPYLHNLSFSPQTASGFLTEDKTIDFIASTNFSSMLSAITNDRGWVTGITSFYPGSVRGLTICNSVFDSSGNIYLLTTLKEDWGLYVRNYLFALNSSGVIRWQHPVSNKSSCTNKSNGHEIALDSQGNIYVAGSFSGNFSFDPRDPNNQKTSDGDQNAFLSKYNQAGGYEWTQVIGNPAAYAAYAVQVDSLDNIYVLGSLSSSGISLFAKYDSSGRYLGSGNSQSPLDADALVFDESGAFYVIGTFSDEFDFDPGSGTYILSSPNTGYFLSRYNKENQWVWSKSLAVPYDWTGLSVMDSAVDTSGRVSMIGTRLVGGDPFPIQAPNNLTASDQAPTIQDNISFLVSFDENGDHLKTIPIASLDSNEDGYLIANSIKIDQDGNKNIVGYFRGNPDFDPTDIVQKRA